jgi:predicted phosphodiesterase
MKVLVFGDAHGNLEGVVNTINQFRKIHEDPLKIAIQLGDLGY